MKKRFKMAVDKRVGIGFNGEVSRINSSFCESAHIKKNNIPNYGTAVKYDGIFLSPLDPNDNAQKICGFFVRQYPSHSYDEFAILTNAGDYNFTANVLKSGYMTVYIDSPTDIKRGDPVYIRVANPNENSPLGSVVTTEIDAVLLPNAYFVSEVDSDNIAEISFKI